ncbi:MAG: tRNA (adenosine(37)-N6)-threonylcarbamoyltransferase complex dimerization subunit type 1 TsaB [Desulfuromonadales bacterium]|nr:tRNA (adenosine(37)-N6)-threonylcarbamoyltransferase complex dimerization subunit type 1 TsaB [Desulfuromonadales bacterium]NIR34017.1 tRNA (adenosine(37)-N6)-threonylcarbamoyltransferase complex dimerization subunit type 1 TsaB [Desulfuromonadales bacterium]NIS44068.1 tRNA (adenosine(37)-N6)-threonylcarbamoyltransferase complex dimerization subunit type 1 TsaB [Desulfuromonadales bacterium]
MVDTSSFTGSVALVERDRVLGEVLLNVRATHSERLMVTIDQLLDDTGVSLDEVAAFGAVLGPGSFTGLRIGVASVKALALAAERPLIGVTSLETLAMNAPYCRLPVCALVDARKKEVYAALYDCHDGSAPRQLRPAVVLPPEELLASLEGEILFIGDGVRVYRNFILHQMRQDAHFLSGALNDVRASQAGSLAWRKLDADGPVLQQDFLPVYLRPSDAEIMWAKRRSEVGIEG